MRKMNRKCPKYRSASRGADNRSAVALVLTLVVLVVLTTVVYTLSLRIATLKHRRQYIIDYQVSRYACDSAMKYALNAAKSLNLKLIDRKDEPDFSDIFTMDRLEYRELLTEWAVKKA